MKKFIPQSDSFFVEFPGTENLKNIQFLCTLTNQLNDAPSFSTAIAGWLETVCQYYHLQIGQLWITHFEAPLLEYFQSWYCPTLNPTVLNHMKAFDSYGKGIGLPGMVWETNEMLVKEEDYDPILFPREAKVRTLGLCSSIGIPIRSRGTFLGVVEFFSNNQEPFQHSSIQFLLSATHQLGLALSIHVAEHALFHTQYRCDQILEHQRILWFQCQLDKTFTLMDLKGKWESIAAFGCEDYLKRPMSLLEICHPDDRNQVYHQLIQSAHTPKSMSIQCRGLGQPGQVKWMEIQGRVVKTGHTQTALTGIIIDRTLSKNLDQAHIRVNQMESMNQLIGGLVHDFNNILTSVIANVILVKLESNPNDRQWLRLSDAEQACLRGRDLTQQLLNATKGESPLRRPTFLGKLLRDSTLIAIAGSTVIPQFVISSDLWPIEINETQMYQVVNNLVINAKQAMPKGGVLIIRADNLILDSQTYESQFLLLPGPYVKITISDQGIGIFPQHLSKIFNAYFTTKKMGTGLGLSTVYSIIKNHGGAISVESEPGIGTTFSIYLPAITGALPPGEEAPNGMNRIPKDRILILDHESHISELATQMLIQIGYEVESATDGMNALERFKCAHMSGNPFAAVLLGLTVPGGIGGEVLLQHLRGIDPHIKALASSGDAGHPVMNDYNAYGFIGAVTKPFNLEELHSAIKKAISSHSPCSPVPKIHLH